MNVESMKISVLLETAKSIASDVQNEDLKICLQNLEIRISMIYAEHSIKTMVNDKWKVYEYPDWDIDKTINECIAVAIYCPLSAPKFLEAVKSRDNSYMRTWVLGCHFKWLKD